MHSCRSPGKLVRWIRELSEGFGFKHSSQRVGHDWATDPIRSDLIWMPRNFINWSCKLTLYQRDWDGGGGQPPVKSEVRAQSIKVGRLWFLGVDTREFPGGLLRLDPAFAYVEPPSSRPLPRVEVLTPAPATLSPWGPLDSLSTCLGNDSLIPPFSFRRIMLPMEKGHCSDSITASELTRGVVPKLVRQHILLILILRISDPGAPNSSWRKLKQ